MTAPKLKAVPIGVLCFIVAIGLYWVSVPRLPAYAGRPIDTWFAELYSGVYGGTPKASKFEAAYAAFGQMGSNAVPFLTKQLRYDRSGYQEKLVVFLRHQAMTRKFAADLIFPTEYRNYAAVALRQMGTNAESAIPALLEACAYDTPAVRVNAVSALESILRGKHTEAATPTEWRKLESELIAEAALRHPQLAEKLGITTQRGP